MKVPFNRPYLSGHEKEYVLAAIDSGFTKGNGPFARKCHEFLERRYGFKKCLLTTSCTDALEMAAILTGVGPGDEVIVPSYTFVFPGISGFPQEVQHEEAPAAKPVVEENVAFPILIGIP